MCLSGQNKENNLSKEEDDLLRRLWTSNIRIPMAPDRDVEDSECSTELPTYRVDETHIPSGKHREPRQTAASSKDKGHHTKFDWNNSLPGMSQAGAITKKEVK